MRQRRLLIGAAAAAAALTLAAGVPAEAKSYGGGAVTGTLGACVAGSTSLTIDSPAFVFNDAVGPLHAEATTNCFGSSIIADTGSGSFSLEGPGVSCPSIGGVWQKLGTHLVIGFGGPCTFTAGGGHNVQFRADAAIAGTAFAGEMFVGPYLGN